MAHPLPQVDFDTMTSARTTEILIASNNTAPLFIDTAILVSDLIDYYNQNFNNQYDGIRFYPGFEMSGKLQHSICVSKLGGDTAFCILSDVDYTHGTSFARIVNANEVETLLHNYRDNVLIEGNAQDPATYLRSRFFDWDSLVNWMTANINNFDINDPNTYRGYSIKIKAAYTSETLSAKFYNEYGVGNNATEQKGYTVTMSMVDPNGNLLIDPALPYQSGQFVNR